MPQAVEAIRPSSDVALSMPGFRQLKPSSQSLFGLGDGAVVAVRAGGALVPHLEVREGLSPAVGVADRDRLLVPVAEARLVGGDDLVDHHPAQRLALAHVDVTHITCASGST